MLRKWKSEKHIFLFYITLLTLDWDSGDHLGHLKFKAAPYSYDNYT